ncbi:hypothetical protein Trydic_g23500 [Trypoxylus dichotomus]
MAGNLGLESEKKVRIKDGKRQAAAGLTTVLRESPDLQTFQFADDTAILAVENTEERCRNKMEAGLESIARYADQWNTKVNENKTENITLGKKMPKEWRVRWRNDRMGITIDKNLHFHKYTKRKAGSTKTRINNFQALLRAESKDVLTPKNEDFQFDRHSERHIRGIYVVPGKPQSPKDSPEYPSHTSSVVYQKRGPARGINYKSKEDKRAG